MSPRFELLHVKPALPPALEPLMELAYNLRWAWHPDTAEVFVRLDKDLWEDTAHNPVRMLGTIHQERLAWAAEDPVFLSHMERAHQSLKTLLAAPAWFQKFHPASNETTIAYFSAEFGLAECLPVYSGGLGILAGDHLKSANELGVPLVGVGLAYKRGYLSQYLNAAGWQQETYDENDFYNMPLKLERTAKGDPLLVSVAFPGRDVKLQIWRAQVGRVPLYLLDANVPENTPEDQRITAQLYGGDRETRIQHEIVLGIGGTRALRALDIRPEVSHINEGHAAFCILERIYETMNDKKVDFDVARQLVSASSIFTTHTPVPAGFDLFGPDLMHRYFEAYVDSLGVSFEHLMAMGSTGPGKANGADFNMALFAMRHSTHRNGVSRLHGKVSREMWLAEWPGYPDDEVPVESITNGIHTRSWISGEMTDLLNRSLGAGWSENPADTEEWKRVNEIPDSELWRTHMESKERLVSFARKRLESQIRNRGGSESEAQIARKILNPAHLTVGFARRFATYKRATLLLHDIDRFKSLVLNADRPVQFLFAGKAHPADTKGKELIQRLVQMAREPEMRASVVFLENYDMNVGRLLTQGVDVWLNTPRRPFEASGTSGMKGAANGVLNLSVLDGWWDEGFEGDVGWAIGKGEMYDDPDEQDRVEANALYELLEKEVIPTYYSGGLGRLSPRWVAMMKAAIVKLAPQFNTNRMVAEYTDRFYVPANQRTRELEKDQFDGARKLVAWRERISENWSEVAVIRVSGVESRHMELGGHFPVEVTVALGGLAPDEVAVEVYHGRANAAREVEHGRITRLTFTRTEGDTAIYSGEVACEESGLYAYGVRLRPHHPLAVVPNEDTHLTWY